MIGASGVALSLQPSVKIDWPSAPGPLPRPTFPGRQAKTVDQHRDVVAILADGSGYFSCTDKK